MGSRREEERNEKIIRGLMKLPPNRKCINCNSVGPQYLCTNFWTFVCLSCSGIHREFTHRVKSVSMSKFTTQEVRALEQGGNQRARDIYLKDWDWQRMRLPVNTNPDRIREFIRAVYVDKKYAGESSNKPAADSKSVKNNDNDMRRASSYHSYSQSPPYDFQYEDRRYGKQVDTLARRPSDRALFDGKLGNLLFSPGRLRDQMNEDRFANESSGSRFSDFSASSTGDFRNDVLSPSSQETGYSSPSVHHSRNVSGENLQSQTYPNAALQIDFNGVRCSQRTASSGSFGSFDGSSVSNKSVESGYLPDAPIEKPVHSVVNHQTVASPVSHSTQSYASLPIKSTMNSSDHNLIPQKPADLRSQTAPTREPVQHGGVHIEAVVTSPVPAQPMTFTTLDLFDQSTVQQLVTSAAPIDLFASFNDQSSVCYKSVDLSSHSDVAKEPAHNVVVQKAVAPSFVPAEALTTSHPLHQDLFSLSVLQEPATSAPPPPIDLFAGFDQQRPHMSSVQQILSAASLPANEGWAFIDAQKPGSLMSVSNVQAQVPAAFPSTDGIAKGIDRSTLPTSPPNASGSHSAPAMMDNWSLNAEEVKISVSKENSQGGMVSHPGRSTNPFDMAFESDVDANNMFMDLTSLQETLPDLHAPTDYSRSFTEPWDSQNSTLPYIPSMPQGGLSYMAGQDSHMLNSTHQGPFPPRNPFE
ncbi:probable ADP-ribosylation factor GTPase-activating protein AGD14 isoform X2 [Phragmites australis]|uniref:probable ADP-ribosylation factor GTPase-activating protein AGD14 isoform X2 n=1 Tax=Phragmites australis TaxID=29695 RepID=UPI002D792336|nr:probable ADP-ribosylation factor GTPase-activating protein AGD14 isoform X2 [Phragmites australis]